MQQVANLEKKVPLDWIAPDGMQVTAAFEEYARPLILDEVDSRLRQRHARATSVCNAPAFFLFPASVFVLLHV